MSGKTPKYKNTFGNSGGGGSRFGGKGNGMGNMSTMGQDSWIADPANFGNNDSRGGHWSNEGDPRGGGGGDQQHWSNHGDWSQSHSDHNSHSMSSWGGGGGNNNHPHSLHGPNSYSSHMGPGPGGGGGSGPAQGNYNHAGGGGSHLPQNQYGGGTNTNASAGGGPGGNMIGPSGGGAGGNNNYGGGGGGPGPGGPPAPPARKDYTQMPPPSAANKNKGAHEGTHINLNPRGNAGSSSSDHHQGGGGGSSSNNRKNKGGRGGNKGGGNQMNNNNDGSRGGNQHDHRDGGGYNDNRDGRGDFGPPRGGGGYGNNHHNAGAGNGNGNWTNVVQQQHHGGGGGNSGVHDQIARMTGPVPQGPVQQAQGGGLAGAGFVANMGMQLPQGQQPQGVFGGPLQQQLNLPLGGHVAGNNHQNPMANGGLSTPMTAGGQSGVQRQQGQPAGPEQLQQGGGMQQMTLEQVQNWASEISNELTGLTETVLQAQAQPTNPTPSSQREDLDLPGSVEAAQKALAGLQSQIMTLRMTAQQQEPPHQSPSLANLLGWTPEQLSNFVSRLATANSTNPPNPNPNANQHQAQQVPTGSAMQPALQLQALLTSLGAGNQMNFVLPGTTAAAVSGGVGPPPSNSGPAASSGNALSSLGGGGANTGGASSATPSLSGAAPNAALPLGDEEKQRKIMEQQAAMMQKRDKGDNLTTGATAQGGSASGGGGTVVGGPIPISDLLPQVAPLPPLGEDTAGIMLGGGDNSLPPSARGMQPQTPSNKQQQQLLPLPPGPGGNGGTNTNAAHQHQMLGAVLGPQVNVGALNATQLSLLARQNPQLSSMLMQQQNPQTAGLQMAGTPADAPSTGGELSNQAGGGFWPANLLQAGGNPSPLTPGGSQQAQHQQQLLPLSLNNNLNLGGNPSAAQLVMSSLAGVCSQTLNATSSSNLVPQHQHHQAAASMNGATPAAMFAGSAGNNPAATFDSPRLEWFVRPGGDPATDEFWGQLVKKCYKDGIAIKFKSAAHKCQESDFPILLGRDSDHGAEEPPQPDNVKNAMHFMAPWKDWDAPIIEQWYLAKMRALTEENAKWSQVHSLTLNMRVLWDSHKRDYKEKRKISFSRFHEPYQEVFRMARHYAEKLSPAKPGVLQDREWLPVALANHAGVGAPTANPSLKNPKERKKCLRVMSFNVLSQHLSDQFSFQFVVLHEGRGDFLQWSVRFQLVIAELKRWDADILCLQEVDQLHCDEVVKALDGVYKVAGKTRRTDSSKDWLLVLYKDSSVSHLHTMHRELMLTPPPQSDGSLGGQMNPHGGAQQRCRFCFQEQEFELVNTHVAGFAPALEPVRARELVSGEVVADPYACAGADPTFWTAPAMNPAVPLILVGDLNGIREESRPVFQGLASAYDANTLGYVMANQEPEITTAHNDTYHSCGELDKILFSPPFRVSQILQIFEEERLTRCQYNTHPLRSMPNPDWPSDHVSLVADLYIPTQEELNAPPQHHQMHHQTETLPQQNQNVAPGAAALAPAKPKRMKITNQKISPDAQAAMKKSLEASKKAILKAQNTMTTSDAGGSSQPSSLLKDTKEEHAPGENNQEKDNTSSSAKNSGEGEVEQDADLRAANPKRKGSGMHPGGFSSEVEETASVEKDENLAAGTSSDVTPAVEHQADTTNDRTSSTTATTTGGTTLNINSRLKAAAAQQRGSKRDGLNPKPAAGASSFSGNIRDGKRMINCLQLESGGTRRPVIRGGGPADGNATAAAGDAAASFIDKQSLQATLLTSDKRSGPRGLGRGAVGVGVLKGADNTKATNLKSSDGSADTKEEGVTTRAGEAGEGPPVKTVGAALAAGEQRAAPGHGAGKRGRAGVEPKQSRAETTAALKDWHKSFITKGTKKGSSAASDSKDESREASAARAHGPAEGVQTDSNPATPKAISALPAASAQQGVQLGTSNSSSGGGQGLFLNLNIPPAMPLAPLPGASTPGNNAGINVADSGPVPSGAGQGLTLQEQLLQMQIAQQNINTSGPPQISAAAAASASLNNLVNSLSLQGAAGGSAAPPQTAGSGTPTSLGNLDATTLQVLASAANHAGNQSSNLGAMSAQQLQHQQQQLLMAHQLVGVLAGGLAAGATSAGNQHQTQMMNQQGNNMGTTNIAPGVGGPGPHQTAGLLPGLLNNLSTMIPSPITGPKILLGNGATAGAAVNPSVSMSNVVVTPIVGPQQQHQQNNQAGTIAGPGPQQQNQMIQNSRPNQHQGQHPVQVAPTGTVYRTSQLREDAIRKKSLHLDGLIATTSSSTAGHQGGGSSGGNHQMNNSSGYGGGSVGNNMGNNSAHGAGGPRGGNNNRYGVGNMKMGNQQQQNHPKGSFESSRGDNASLMGNVASGGGTYGSSSSGSYGGPHLDRNPNITTHQSWVQDNSYYGGGNTSQGQQGYGGNPHGGTASSSTTPRAGKGKGRGGDKDHNQMMNLNQHQSWNNTSSHNRNQQSSGNSHNQQGNHSHSQQGAGRYPFTPMSRQDSSNLSYGAANSRGGHGGSGGQHQHQLQQRHNDYGQGSHYNESYEGDTHTNRGNKRGPPSHSQNLPHTQHSSSSGLGGGYNTYGAGGGAGGPHSNQQYGNRERERDYQGKDQQGAKDHSRKDHAGKDHGGKDLHGGKDHGGKDLYGGKDHGGKDLHGRKDLHGGKEHGMNRGGKGGHTNNSNRQVSSNADNSSYHQQPQQNTWSPSDDADCWGHVRDKQWNDQHVNDRRSNWQETPSLRSGKSGPRPISGSGSSSAGAGAASSSGSPLQPAALSNVGAVNKQDRVADSDSAAVSATPSARAGDTPRKAASGQPSEARGDNATAATSISDSASTGRGAAAGGGAKSSSSGKGRDGSKSGGRDHQSSTGPASTSKNTTGVDSNSSGGNVASTVASSPEGKKGGSSSPGDDTAVADSRLGKFSADHVEGTTSASATSSTTAASGRKSGGKGNNSASANKQDSADSDHKQEKSSSTASATSAPTTATAVQQQPSTPSQQQQQQTTQSSAAGDKGGGASSTVSGGTSSSTAKPKWGSVDRQAKRELDVEEFPALAGGPKRGSATKANTNRNSTSEDHEFHEAREHKLRSGSFKSCDGK